MKISFIIVVLSIFFVKSGIAAVDFDPAVNMSPRRLKQARECCEHVYDVAKGVGKGHVVLSVNLNGTEYDIRSFMGETGPAGREVASCLVATYESRAVGGPIFVVHRGTVGPVGISSDWRTNLDSDPVAMHGFPGMVHAGYERAQRSFYAALTAHIAGILAARPASELIFSGHSLGGALALLSAIKASRDFGLVLRENQVKVLSFSAPKFADYAFFSHVSATHLKRTSVLNFYSTKDPVPLFFSAGRTFGIPIEHRFLEKLPSHPHAIEMDSTLIENSYRYFLQGLRDGKSLEEAGRAPFLSGERNRIFRALKRLILS